MSKLDNIYAYTHNTLKLYCELFNNDYSKLYYKDAPLWQIESTQQLVTEVLSGKGLSAEGRHNLSVAP